MASATRTPLQIMDAVHALLKTWGVTVAQRAGWRTRSYKGRTFTPQLIIEHHTGGNTTSDALLANGRSDLPGPLCHWTIDRDGTIRAISSGYANHAGINNRAAVAKALTGPAAKIIPAADNAGYSANSISWGIEVKAGGSWTPAQVKACTLLEAALIITHGWAQTRVAAHKEITRRKPDPIHDMAARRKTVAAEVAARIAKPTPKPSKVPTLGRFGVLNCGAWGKTSLPAKTITALVGALGRINASIYSLTECPEWLRDHLRGICKCRKGAHAIFGAASRWKVVVRGSQAILFDSKKWRLVSEVPVPAMPFKPTDYHGGLWAIFEQTTTKARVTIGCYHLPPNTVASQASQRTLLQKFAAKIATRPALIGGDGADSGTWIDWDDARIAAKASPNREAPTYGKAIRDRAHSLGLTIRRYTVVPSKGATDHEGLLIQFTIPAGPTPL